MRRLFFFIICTLGSMNSEAQETISLYADSIPNSKPAANEEYSETAKEGFIVIHKISRPSISIYLPPKEKATGTAVIICPGGSYWIVAAGHEGNDVAKRFTERGVAAFVVKYRIPDTVTMVNKEIGPLQDAQRAIQLVRENAAQWDIDRNKIGIMGFSAGGHLASTAGTHFSKAYIPNPTAHQPPPGLYDPVLPRYQLYRQYRAPGVQGTADREECHAGKNKGL